MLTPPLAAALVAYAAALSRHASLACRLPGRECRSIARQYRLARVVRAPCDTPQRYAWCGHASEPRTAPIGWQIDCHTTPQPPRPSPRRSPRVSTFDTIARP